MKKYIVIATLMTTISFNAMASIPLFKTNNYSAEPNILTLNFKTPSGKQIKLSDGKMYAGYYKDGVCRHPSLFIISGDIDTGAAQITSENLIHTIAPDYSCLMAEFTYNGKTVTTGIIQLTSTYGKYTHASPDNVNVDFTK